MRKVVSCDTRMMNSFTLIQCDVTALIPFDIDFHYIIHAASYAGPAPFIMIRSGL